MRQADLVRNQMDLFKFMYTNGIGTTYALFWAAWAMVAEKNDNYKDADKLYTKGIKKCVECDWTKTIFTEHCSV